MLFTKRIRDGVRRGTITCSVRIWQQPRVKVGHRYRMGEGAIEVDAIEPIDLADVTPQLARESGFSGVVDLLKTAKHGRGTNVYLVRFHYAAPDASRAGTRAAPKTRPKKASPRAGKAVSKCASARVLRMLERLPEAAAVRSGRHLSLEVRKKRFGYFLDDHHGDGRVAINCKSTPELSETLAEIAPSSFHVPKYLGSRGWIGLWLDVPDVRWQVIELALREAYALSAPRTVGKDSSRKHAPDTGTLSAPSRRPRRPLRV
jgi:hypothetical protein